VIFEEVEAGISLKYRNKFINLVNYAMESGDLLLINGIDSLGGNFNEVASSVNLIFKKIRLICLDFSKNEIVGDLKKLFMHFLKLCSDFKEKSSFSKEHYE
jgi:putative DNA-invertase from lambdoid prophage Rac